MTEPAPEDFAAWLNVELLRGYKAEVAANISCLLCGQPGLPGLEPHDDAACEAKMAAWKPTGILSALSSADMAAYSGDPAAFRRELFGEWEDDR